MFLKTKHSVLLDHGTWIPAFPFLQEAAFGSNERNKSSAIGISGFLDPKPPKKNFSQTWMYVREYMQVLLVSYIAVFGPLVRLVQQQQNVVLKSLHRFLEGQTSLILRVCKPLFTSMLYLSLAYPSHLYIIRFYTVCLHNPQGLVCP